MKSLNVLVLFNSEGIAPEDQDFSYWLDDEDNEDWDAERDVINALKRLGYNVSVLGIYDDIMLLINTIQSNRPDMVFNLTEHFDGISCRDKDIISVLELFDIPFTGTGPEGLMICRNKALSKKILTYHKIRVPNFAVFHKGKKVWRPKRLKFPLIVKPLNEDASTGISQSSFVDDDESLIQRVKYIQESMDMDVIVEEYIEGREIYVSVIGNKKLQVLPFREIKFSEVPEENPRIATYKAKWDFEYRERWGITNVFAGRLPDGVSEKVVDICKKAYRVLLIRGYGRFDIRIASDKKIYIIEPNPNPWLAGYDEIAESANKMGLSFDNLIQKIIRLALYS